MACLCMCVCGVCGVCHPDPGAQSMCRRGVAVDPAVAVRTAGCLFVML